MEKLYVQHRVTQQDMDNNPDGGLVLGELIGIPLDSYLASSDKNQNSN